MTEAEANSGTRSAAIFIETEPDAETFKALSLPEMLQAIPQYAIQLPATEPLVPVDKYMFKPRLAKIVCADGTSLSVQASEYHHSTPRSNAGPYTHVEVGFPSTAPPTFWKDFCEDPEKPTETVYGYVPIDYVLFFIASHGGIDREVTFKEGLYFI